MNILMENARIFLETHSMASVLLSIVVRKWLISKTGVSRDLNSGKPGVLKKTPEINRPGQRRLIG